MLAEPGKRKGVPSARSFVPTRSKSVSPIFLRLFTAVPIVPKGYKYAPSATRERL